MNSRLKGFSILSFSFLFSLQILFAQEDGSSNVSVPFEKRFTVGEELTYIVKFAFLDLGEIKTKLYAKELINGKSIYKSIVKINSYDGLPFVNIHQDYESWFDSTLYPVYFQAYIYDEEDTIYVKYYFQENNIVHVIKGKLRKNKPYLDTLVNLHKKYVDGLSLLYFARYFFNGNQTVTVPCYVNEDTTSTLIAYHTEPEDIEIDEVDYDIDCVMLDGRTNFTGIFGLTGEFEGWFSNDRYRIPIKANLEVLIGSVTVELMRWRKIKWNPPKIRD